jgi:phage shock protein C
VPLDQKDKTMNGRFVINRTRAKVMGVCAGLADWMGIDVLVVRLGVIVATLVTGPVAVLLYILTGWLASDDR